MPRVFFGAAHDQTFKSWLDTNPDGFYLNGASEQTLVKESGLAFMHRVGCSHLQDGRPVQYTTYAKVAAATRDELEAWVSERTNVTVRYCASCKPDGR